MVKLIRYFLNWIGKIFWHPTPKQLGYYPRWAGKNWVVYNGVEWEICEPPPYVYDVSTKTYYKTRDLKGNS